MPKGPFKKILSQILIFSLLLLYGYGCMPPRPVCVKNGRNYCKLDDKVFTYQCYDHYERALSCMEGECYDNALADLGEAIRQRFEDKRMAKTYGMRLSDYFPHREKGLIHYLQKDYDAAKQELELSLQHYPSEKAYQYLDKVRREIMLREAVAVSIPRIMITGPSAKDGIWTNDDPVRVSGMATDTQYVSAIRLAGRSVFIDHSDQRVPFEGALTLAQGTHEVDIMARNLMGGEGTRKLTIHVDRSGPVIIIEKFEPGVRVQGYLYDDTGDISLNMDGERKDVPKGKEVPFSLTLTLGQRSITLRATDKLENGTEARITPEMMARIRHPLLLAQTQPKILTDGGKMTLAFLNQGDMRPDIRLNQFPDQPTTKEILPVKGQVIGKTNIQEVRINGTPVHRRPGRVISFNHPVRLKLGENRIVVRARDASGKESVKEMTITRRIHELLKAKYRCLFEAHDFDITVFDDARETTEGKVFQHLFLGRLTAKDRFQIRMRKALHEQHLDGIKMASFPADKSLRPVAFKLLGRVYQTNNGIEVIAELIDVETSEKLAIAGEPTVDVYSESDSRSALEGVAERLSEKFHRAFPLIKGKIIQKKGETFFCADMEEGEIRMIWPLVVGTETKFIGNASIDEKRKDRIYCIRLLNNNGNAPVMGDWVMTQ